MQEYNLML